MGKRPEGLLPFGQPYEIGYHCPVCEYPLTTDGNYDERLQFSEYEGFMWCACCNVDYPSCLCLPDEPQRAITVYLDTVEAAIRRKQESTGPTATHEIDVDDERRGAQGMEEGDL